MVKEKPSLIAKQIKTVSHPWLFLCIQSEYNKKNPAKLKEQENKLFCMEFFLFLGWPTQIGLRHLPKEKK
jgi:hypothetical protein